MVTSVGNPFIGLRALLFACLTVVRLVLANISRIHEEINFQKHVGNGLTMNIGLPHVTSSSLSREQEYYGVLQSLITSTKLLREATQASTLPVSSLSLLEVAIDQLEKLKTLKVNKDIGEELAEKIVHHVSTIHHELSRQTGVEGISDDQEMQVLFQDAISRYTNAISLAQDGLTKLTHRGLFVKSILRSRDRRELQNLTLMIDGEFKNLMAAIGKSQPTRERRRSLHFESGFSSSPLAVRPSSPSPSQFTLPFGNQPFLGQATPLLHCWPGTRIPILDEIDQWATSIASSSKQSSNSLIYWLADVSGSGKSTIALQLADEWLERGLLGGYFDCATVLSAQRQPPKQSSSFQESAERTDKEESSYAAPCGEMTNAICEAWAEQLAASYSELTTTILRAISSLHRTAPNSPSRTFAAQFQSLILTPLKHLQRSKYDLSPQAKVVFVLDHMEAIPSGNGERREVLRALKSINAASGVKILIISPLPTSDEDHDILSELLQSSYPSGGQPTGAGGNIVQGSINIHSASNMADILLYLTAQFHLHSAQLHASKRFRSALIEPTIRMLTKKADGLILWSKLAFEMVLLTDNPTKMLLNLVEEDALGDINGLYLELVLRAQMSLDVINKRGGDYPKNAIARILSAVGYSFDILSVGAIARLTGFELEHTLTVIKLLKIVMDIATPEPRAGRGLMAHDMRSSSRTQLTSGATSSMSLPKSSKRSRSKARESSFSPARSKSAHSNARRRSDATRVRGQDLTVETTLLIPSSPKNGIVFPSDSPSTVLNADIPDGDTKSAQSSALVKTKHPTFLDWIRLPHPPTLLSSLTGKSTEEEDDIRFVVAPSKQGAHEMLARACFDIIRTDGEKLDINADNLPPNKPERRRVAIEATQAVPDDLLYACRRWPRHCAQLLRSIDPDAGSNIFMSIAATGGERWSPLREDMLDFFSHKLLWWVDVCSSKGWISEALVGVTELKRALQGVPPEDQINESVEALIQWCEESLRLFAFAERNASWSDQVERDAELSLIWQHYAEELMARAKMPETRFANKAETVDSSHSSREVASNDDHLDLLPPPPISELERLTRRRASSRVSSAGSHVASAKAASISTKQSASSEQEPDQRLRRVGSSLVAEEHPETIRANADVVTPPDLIVVEEPQLVSPVADDTAPMSASPREDSSNLVALPRNPMSQVEATRQETPETAQDRSNIQTPQPIKQSEKVTPLPPTRRIPSPPAGQPPRAVEPGGPAVPLPVQHLMKTQEAKTLEASNESNELPATALPSAPSAGVPQHPLSVPNPNREENTSVPTSSTPGVSSNAQRKSAAAQASRLHTTATVGGGVTWAGSALFPSLSMFQNTANWQSVSPTPQSQPRQSKTRDPARQSTPSPVSTPPTNSIIPEEPKSTQAPVAKSKEGAQTLSQKESKTAGPMDSAAEFANFLATVDFDKDSPNLQL